jgi:hypothetical protein
LASDRADNHGVPAKDYPFGPFRSDRLIYLNDVVVEFETAARSEGLEPVVRWMLPSSDPIRGVAILETQVFALQHLAVRLPAGRNDLTPIVIKHFEGQN